MVVSSLSKESSDAETNNFPRPLIVKADVDMKTIPVEPHLRW